MRWTTLKAIAIGAFCSAVGFMAGYISNTSPPEQACDAALMCWDGSEWGACHAIDQPSINSLVLECDWEGCSYRYRFDHRAWDDLPPMLPPEVTPPITLDQLIHPSAPVEKDDIILPSPVEGAEEGTIKAFPIPSSRR